MSIKENELPIAESLGDGDTLRIVDANGASKRVGADGVGGGVLIESTNETPMTLPITPSQLEEYLSKGLSMVFHNNRDNVYDNSFTYQPIIPPNVERYSLTAFQGYLFWADTENDYFVEDLD